MLAFQTGLCVGAISGIIFAADGICPPEGTTRLQSVTVVIHYIDKHPEKMQEGFQQL
jgi:hypothetical protein